MERKREIRSQLFSGPRLEFTILPTTMASPMLISLKMPRRMFWTLSLRARGGEGVRDPACRTDADAPAGHERRSELLRPSTIHKTQYAQIQLEVVGVTPGLGHLYESIQDPARVRTWLWRTGRRAAGRRR